MDLTDDKSTLVKVMAWCHQATSHHLSQCWPRFMSPCGITRPQWVELLCFHWVSTKSCWSFKIIQNPFKIANDILQYFSELWGLRSIESNNHWFLCVNNIVNCYLVEICWIFNTKLDGQVKCSWKLFWKLIVLYHNMYNFCYQNVPKKQSVCHHR